MLSIVVKSHPPHANNGTDEGHRQVDGGWFLAVLGRVEDHPKKDGRGQREQDADDENGEHGDCSRWLGMLAGMVRILAMDSVQPPLM